MLGPGVLRVRVHGRLAQGCRLGIVAARRGGRPYGRHRDGVAFHLVKVGRIDDVKVAVVLQKGSACRSVRTLLYAALLSAAALLR